ncbi:MAG: hypothetical protein JJ966_09625 [Balneolaceae bacterium]|nr:hypothetical protein [Balneolaceae bacterium]
MPNTDILKLIFHHDQRMEQLAPATASETENDPLAMFTQPDPTYSTLYFSGSVIEEQQFGINNLSRFDPIIQTIQAGLGAQTFQTANGSFSELKQALLAIENNEMILLADETLPAESIHSFSGKVLRDILEKGWIAIYKREAPNGFDVQIFSRDNLYTRFFYPLQKMLEPEFRVFSINGKRVSSERHFYFETWTLHKPPHGFEEILPESVL